MKVICFNLGIREKTILVKDLGNFEWVCLLRHFFYVSPFK